MSEDSYHALFEEDSFALYGTFKKTSLINAFLSVKNIGINIIPEKALFWSYL